MKEITIEAKIENIPVVTDFVDEQLELHGCAMKAIMQINVAIDELFGNISHYAYNPENGMATIRVDVDDDTYVVAITFEDKGVPFDPLNRPDPDVSLTMDEREVGGLGILMVKKVMDEVTYEYKDGTNILTIKKAWA
ncbi:MAG: ATP-binding protein [Bacteroidaceae bacterium]|nr:ATP-binding protein [Bacteroidaceae bacterium]